MNTSVTSSIDTNQSALWSFERGRSPLVGTAIHDGHHVWPDLVETMELDDAGRLREEDPFTAEMIADIANRVVVHRSRFEVDLNRPSEGAVYLTPEQAWGLQVWNTAPEGERLAALLSQHAAYYTMLRAFLDSIVAQHGRFVLLDMHSYNHRRDGAEAAPTDPEKAPVINIGTFSMDRGRWAHVLDPFIAVLRDQTVMGQKLDVRENIAFEGRGEQTRFVHEHFPQTGCAIAVEFKKVFMDEWTGEPDRMVIAELRAAIAASLPTLLDALDARP